MSVLGHVVGERYRLEERLAVGGMGEVWRAVDDRLGRPVAVKLLKPELAGEPGFLERFRGEGRHAALLSHPGIASVFDYGEVDGSAYLVMELVEGEPLSHLLARAGRLPLSQALDIVGQAGVALQAAHDAGVVHRDIKPGNLLVRPDGLVKVTDFGIARAVDAVPLTATGVILGTAHYLSPEQAEGLALTPATDVYSLGVVAYECLAGERPFTGTHPIAIAQAHARQAPPPLPPDIPPPVRALVEQALAKDPAQRPASAGEFGRAALALAAAWGGAAADLGGGPYPGDHPRSDPATAATLAATRPYPVPAAGGVRGERGVLAVLTAALVAVAVVLLVAGGTPAAPASPAPTPTTSAPAPRTVEVVASRYVGESVATATAQLKALGLAVRVTYTASHGAPGSVTDVRPSGELPVGRTVTLVAVAPVTTAPTTQPADQGNGGDHGGGGDGKGNGHGKGHGKGKDDGD